MQRADSKNLFQLTACVLLNYSTSDARSVKEHVIRKPKGTKEVWFHTFYVRVPLFGPGPESFKKYNSLSFVSRAKLKTLTVKQGSIALFFSLSLVSVNAIYNHLLQ